MKATDESANNGRNRRVSAPLESPAEWELTGGRPVWIDRLAPPSASWSSIRRGERVWFELPTFDRQPPEHHGYGRPPNRETRPDDLRLAAYLRAFGDTFESIASLFEFADWRAAKRLVRGGESLLHDEAVIPFEAFPDGKLPDEWWTHPDCLGALERWTIAAVQHQLVESVERASRRVYRAVYRTPPFPREPREPQRTRTAP
jgi:hypothetical protein